MRKKAKHVGLHADRTRHEINKRERVLAEEWERAQNPPSWLNRGVGVLEALLGSDYTQHPFPFVDPDKTSPRDAEVAATVIQWLGTNVGFAWLRETLEKAGFKVSEVRP